MWAQTPSTPPPAQQSTEEEENPFQPQPPPALPVGATGSDANDLRAKLTPGLYDAGETSMGIKHLALVKKPDAFQLGTSEPDDPKVLKMIDQMGMSNSIKIAKPFQLVIAELAFANSDLAFQGNHLFQGNFYGVSIYDISNPANTTLVTSLVCPGGQGDVPITMDDGVTLRADMFSPIAEGRYPVIMSMGAYGKGWDFRERNADVRGQ